MKKLVAVTILTVIASSVGLAADLAKEQAPAPEKAKPVTVAPQDVQHQRQTVELTGSYIKRPIRRDGKITDGSSQVIVLDREMIHRSGAGDLRQALIRQGIH